MINLQTIRKNLKKTQEEVAQDLNIKKQTYQNYELGKREPDIEMLKKMASYYNVSLDYLCNRTWDNKAYIEVWKLSEEQKANLYLIEKLSPKNNLRANGYLLGLLQEQQASEC